MTLALAATFFAFATAPSLADWPQWRGPDRDGHSPATGLLKSWPDSGPKMSWKAQELGTGYSAVSVTEGRVFTMGTREDQAWVFCLSLKDGSVLWQTAVGKAGGDDDYNTGWGAGQRSTPTVDGNQVFVMTDLGKVVALDKSSGAVQWSVEMVAEYGGKVPTWGYSESVLVDGDRVVVTPGEVNFMVALNRQTGKKIWGSKDFNGPAQYVSVMKGNVGSKSFYVTASKPGLVAFDVQTGEKLFEDSATGNKVAVIPTPILAGDLLYHTSAYGAGNTLLKLSPSASGIDAESIYALNIKSMENHHGGVVLVDGVIYGFTKPGGGNWMAQELESGETLWREKINRNKSGSICFADGMLYCYNDKDGTVLLVEANPSGFNQTGQLTLPEQTSLPRKQGAIWAHPVVSNGKLIIRDQDLMYVYDIAASNSKR